MDPGPCCLLPVYTCHSKVRRSQPKAIISTVVLARSAACAAEAEGGARLVPCHPLSWALLLLLLLLGGRSLCAARPVVVGLHNTHRAHQGQRLQRLGVHLKYKCTARCCPLHTRCQYSVASQRGVHTECSPECILPQHSQRDATERPYTLLSLWCLHQQHHPGNTTHHCTSECMCAGTCP
jgi:hypothetical protein